jgi:hypothetical protein
MPRPSKLAEETRKQVWAADHPKIAVVADTPAPSGWVRFVRMALASGPLALFFGCIWAYFSLAGVVDSMNAARVVLIVGALILIAGILVSEFMWGKSRKTIVLTGVVAVLVLGLGLWQLDVFTVRYRIAYAPPSVRTPLSNGVTFDDVTFKSFGSTQIQVNDGTTLNMKGDSSISNGKVGVENNGGHINMDGHASVHDNEKNVVLNPPKKKKAEVKPPPQP